MALHAPVKYVRLPSPLLANGSTHRRGFRVSATSVHGNDAKVVDWAKETATFFERDSRPIMLFDGVCNLCNGGVKFVRDHDKRSTRRRGFRVSATSVHGNDAKVVDWAKETATFFERDSRPIMLFDGVCNLCNGGVKFVRDHDKRRNIRFEALQSEAGKKLLQRSGRAPDDISSVVLVEKERSYIKSEAVLKIMQYIDLPFPQLAVFLQFVPLFVRDFVYENIADNRYNIFGRTESCEL